MLSIKPVMHVDDGGHLVPVSKARGRKSSLLALVDQMEATAIDPASQTVFISHGDCEGTVPGVSPGSSVMVKSTRPPSGGKRNPMTVSMM